MSMITGQVTAHNSSTQTEHSPPQLPYQSPGAHVVFMIENSDGIVWFLGLIDGKAENGEYI